MRTSLLLLALAAAGGFIVGGAQAQQAQVQAQSGSGTYASNIAVTGPDTLRVEGCVGMICGGETWTRVGH